MTRMPLIEVPAYQGATNATSDGAKNSAAKGVTGQRAACTASDGANRTVTPAALVMIIAIPTIIAMPLVVVARVLIAWALSNCRCCGDEWRRYERQ